MSTIDVERLHALGGDDNDLGFWAKGHHSEADMRAAVITSYGERHNSCVADPAECSWSQQWWRKVPRAGGAEFQFHSAKAGTPGAFPVTALLTEQADI